MEMEEMERDVTLYKTVGLILAVNTSLAGDQLLFRYPSVIRQQVSAETLRAFAHNKSNDSVRNSKENTTFSTSSPTVGKEGVAVSEGKFGNSFADIQQYEAYNLPSPTLAPQLVPKPALCNMPFQLTIENTVFVGYPTLLRENEKIASDPTNDPKKTAEGQDVLRLFNFVIVLAKDENSAQEGKFSSGSLEQFKNIAHQISIALEYEQRRSGYMTDQAGLMLNIREAWLIAQRDERTDVSKPDHQALTSQLLSVAHLAREMREMYHMLKEEGNLNIRLNGWVTVICSLEDPQDHPSWSIRPYHTLLILSTKQQRWSTVLPPDSSPLLRKLMEVARPTKSFRDLQLELDIPFSYLYRLAGHLVYWKRAKIVNTLTKNNIYILNHKIDLPSYRLLGEEFSNTFPNFRFEEILERFSMPKTLGEHSDFLLITSLQRDFVEVVIWLLQKDVIVQQHTFVFLILSAHRLPPTPVHLFNQKATLSDEELDRLSENATSARPKQLQTGSAEIFIPELCKTQLASYNTERRYLKDINDSRTFSFGPHVYIKDAMFYCQDGSEFKQLFLKKVRGSPSAFQILAVGTGSTQGIYIKFILGISTKGQKEDESGNEIVQMGPFQFISKKRETNRSAVSVLRQFSSVKSAEESLREEDDLPTESEPYHNYVPPSPIEDPKVENPCLTAPIPLSSAELYILQKYNDKGPLFQNLLRLCPYFRGRHHFEEIMFRENISRDDLVKVIQRYQGINSID